MATAVPAQLQQAIDQASKEYGLPPDLLAGIWRIESGSTYPNPAVNASGYGGLFGTRDPYGPPLQQAELAASILETGLQNFHGNISEALSYYNSGRPTGGYTSVPGETSFGIAKGYHSKQSGGGFGFGTVINDIGSTFIPGYGDSGLASVGSAVGGAVDSTLGGVGHAIASPFESALSSVEKAALRGAMILGGFLVALVGLYLIANSLGLAPGVGTVAGVAVTKGKGIGSEGRAVRQAEEQGERQAVRHYARKAAREEKKTELERPAAARRAPAQNQRKEGDFFSATE